MSDSPKPRGGELCVELADGVVSDATLHEQILADVDDTDLRRTSRDGMLSVMQAMRDAWQRDPEGWCQTKKAELLEQGLDADAAQRVVARWIDQFQTPGALEASLDSVFGLDDNAKSPSLDKT